MALKSLSRTITAIEASSVSYQGPSNSLRKTNQRLMRSVPGELRPARRCCVTPQKKR